MLPLSRTPRRPAVPAVSTPIEVYHKREKSTRPRSLPVPVTVAVVAPLLLPVLLRSPMGLTLLPLPTHPAGRRGRRPHRFRW